MDLSVELFVTNKPKTSISEAVKEYGKRLWAFVRNKVKSNEDADDILQEVWYQFSSLANIDELESTSGWLYQVARNKVIDSYRRKKNSSLEGLPYETEEGDLRVREILLADDNSPEMEMFKNLFWEQLMDALDELPVNQGEVFVWNELEDLTLQEIATRQGENLKTVISRKGYAVKHLRKRLEFLYAEINNS